MSARIPIHVRDDLPEAASAVVDSGLDAYNTAAAPLHEVRPLSCFARAASGEIVGGVIGRTWGACCEIRQLWVAETERGRGLGTRLVRALEQRAVERGRSTFYLETWTFQACAFYERMGYGVRLAIDGYAPGVAKFVMMREADAGVAPEVPCA